MPKLSARSETNETVVGKYSSSSRKIAKKSNRLKLLSKGNCDTDGDSKNHPLKYRKIPRDLNCSRELDFSQGFSPQFDLFAESTICDFRLLSSRFSPGTDQGIAQGTSQDMGNSSAVIRVTPPTCLRASRLALCGPPFPRSPSSRPFGVTPTAEGYSFGVTGTPVTVRRAISRRPAGARSLRAVYATFYLAWPKRSNGHDGM